MRRADKKIKTEKLSNDGEKDIDETSPMELSSGELLRSSQSEGITVATSDSRSQSQGHLVHQ